MPNVSGTEGVADRDLERSHRAEFAGIEPSHACTTERYAAPGVGRGDGFAKSTLRVLVVAVLGEAGGGEGDVGRCLNEFAVWRSR